MCVIMGMQVNLLDEKKYYTQNLFLYWIADLDIIYFISLK